MHAVSPNSLNSSHTKYAAGRTFLVGMSLLGLVAIGQVTAVLWHTIHERSRPAGVTAATVAPQPVATPAPPLASESPVANQAVATPTPAPLSMEEIMAAEAERRLLANMPKPTPVPLPGRSPEALQLARVQHLVNTSRTHRDKGDMVTALTRLREALAISPRNPQVISEMAIAYEKMGLTDKAAAQWRRIYELGEQAGIYYAAAEAKLLAFEIPSAPTIPISEPTFEGALLGEDEATGHVERPSLLLGDVGVTDDTGNSQPLRQLRLRVPIHCLPGASISPDDVTIQVFFYDQFGDGSLVQTNAEVSSSWAARYSESGEESPIDWSSPDGETLEISYAQVPPESRTRRQSQRNYYGYIVRVYYKGELNASAAEPERLLKQYPAPITLHNSDLPE